MTIHRRRRRSGPLAAPLTTAAALVLGVVGCSTPPSTDAGDGGGTDVQHLDVQHPDVPQNDVQPDMMVAPMDVQTDVPSDGADAGVPDPTPMTVTRVADCGTACRRPTDAVLNSDGSVVFFTASDAAGHGGVFRVTATGGAITQISTGSLLQFPVSIAISDDNATLYIADLAADASVTTNQTATNPTGGLSLGGVFSMAATGGTPVRVSTMDMISQPAGIALDGANLIVSGRAIGAMGVETPAVFSVPVAGGTPAVITTMAMGLAEPTDLAVTAAGAYYTVDTGRGSLSARVAHAAATVSFATGGGTIAAFPAGIASSRDGSHLLAAAWLPGATGRLTYTNVDGTMPVVVVSPDIVSPTGIGRAHSAPVYVVADELARPAGADAGAAPGTGSIFLVR